MRDSDGDSANKTSVESPLNQPPESRLNLDVRLLLLNMNLLEMFFFANIENRSFTRFMSPWYLHGACITLAVAKKKKKKKTTTTTHSNTQGK